MKQHKRLCVGRESCTFAISLMVFVLLAAFVLAPQARAQFSGAVSPASAYSIPQPQLIQPDALSRLLRAPAAARPLVLQVGSRIFFSQAHIPGSIYAGPGSQPAGLQLLESSVASSPKDRLIILYCGCCPWNRCPNVGPAYHRLRDLGFTHVKVLYLASNFGDDWVAKGYPVEEPQ
jgi:rhodanese-related sulfurtransferase